MYHALLSFNFTKLMWIVTIEQSICVRVLILYCNDLFTSINMLKMFKIGKIYRFGDSEPHIEIQKCFFWPDISTTSHEWREYWVLLLYISRGGKYSSFISRGGKVHNCSVWKSFFHNGGYFWQSALQRFIIMTHSPHWCIVLYCSVLYPQGIWGQYFSD